MKSPIIHLVLTLIIGLLAIGTYVAGYWIVAGKVTKVADLKSQIVEENVASAHLSGLRAMLSGLAADEAAMQAYFISDATVVPFISELEADGQAQHAIVSVGSVSTNSASKFASPSILLTVSIDGSFDAVMRTVGNIEYMPYNVSIGTLAIRKDMPKNEWHADMNLVVGLVTATTTKP